MSITQEQVKNIAKKLAKVKSKNEEKLVENMNSILNYIDLLNEVDTSGVAPTVSVIQENNSLPIINNRQSAKNGFS